MLLSVAGFEPSRQRRELARQIGVVFGQRTQLWWDLPATDAFDLLKAIYEIPEKLYRERLNTLAELLDVTRLLKTQIRRLSLGERMKMELIGALLHWPPPGVGGMLQRMIIPKCEKRPQPEPAPRAARDMPRYDIPQARPMAAAIAYALHAPSLMPDEAAVPAETVDTAVPVDSATEVSPQIAAAENGEQPPASP